MEGNTLYTRQGSVTSYGDLGTMVEAEYGTITIDWGMEPWDVNLPTPVTIGPGTGVSWVTKVDDTAVYYEHPPLDGAIPDTSKLGYISNQQIFQAFLSGTPAKRVELTWTATDTLGGASLVGTSHLFYNDAGVFIGADHQRIEGDANKWLVNCTGYSEGGVSNVTGAGGGADFDMYHDNGDGGRCRLSGSYSCTDGTSSLTLLELFDDAGTKTHSGSEALGSFPQGASGQYTLNTAGTATCVDITLQ